MPAKSARSPAPMTAGIIRDGPFASLTALRITPAPPDRLDLPADHPQRAKDIGQDKSPQEKCQHRQNRGDPALGTTFPPQLKVGSSAAPSTTICRNHGHLHRSPRLASG